MPTFGVGMLGDGLERVLDTGRGHISPGLKWSKGRLDSGLYDFGEIVHS